MTDQTKPVVLVAEDEPSVAEGYELWLADRYEVRLAADGREAVEMVDGSVDAVLLDRMMPELSGEQVLGKIRDRGIDCRVAMVTAVEPDFDVIEMGFDAYITKPPERQELLDTIDRLLGRAELDENFREYHSLMARKGALQVQKTEEELTDNEAYQRLLERIEAAREAVDEDIGDVTEEIEFVSAVRDIEDADDGGEVDLGDIDGFENDGDPFADETDTDSGTPDEEQR